MSLAYFTNSLKTNTICLWYYYLNPPLKKTWCLASLDSRFLARMEQLLHLYALPEEAAYPVVCFDERPCYLIGETR